MTSVILNGFTVATYASFSVFPSSAADGTLAVDLLADKLYEFDEPTASWILIGPGSGGGGVAVVTASGPLSSSGGTNPNITIQTASSTQAGALSAADWATFNAKQPAGSYITALTGDVTAAGPGSSAASLTATTNATITTLSALSLPGSQVTGNISGNAANVTATSNSTLTTLSSLSLPGSQVSGNIPGNAANITATSNTTLTSLPDLSLPGSQVSGNIPGNAVNITATSNSTLTTLSSLSLPGSQVSGNIPGNSVNVTGTVAIANGGTGQTTQQLAINALAGAVTSGTYLRGNGTNDTMSSIQVSDVPILNQNTTGNAANITATSNSTLTTLSSLSLPTTQLSGQVTLSQLPSIAGDTFLANGTGSTATPTALTIAQVVALLPAVVGATGSTAGAQGLVPAPPAYSGLAGQFLSANGTYVTIDQSNTINPDFSLVATAPAPAGAIKFETTQIFTSITTGKPYAVGIGFIGSPTLTIWDISDQTKPVLTGSFVAAGGGAYNCTFGVVAGVQYAFVGYNSGSHFVVVNLSNPALPVQVSNTTITGSPGSIYGVSFLNGYVYCATQSTGLVVMDVGGGTGSPAVPVQTYQQAGGVKSFGVVAIGTNVYTTQYSTSSPYTLRQIISWTLTGAGTASVPSLLQSLQVTTAGEALGLSVFGNTAFVTTAATGAYNIDLVDITNPTAMTNLSNINSTNIFGSGFYATAVGNILYIPSGGNVTYGGAIDAYDITNRSSPIHIAQTTLGIPSNAFGTIAAYGGYLFVADYGNSAGTTGQLEVFTQLNNTNIFGNGIGSTLTLNSLTPNTVTITNGSDQLISSSVTATELSYVHGVTSNIQTQLNAIVAGEGYKGNEFTLSPTDIANKFVTLSSVPTNPTLTLLNVIGGPMQQYTLDFIVSGSTLSWSGLFLDGVLVSGDVLIVQFY